MPYDTQIWERSQTMNVQDRPMFNKNRYRRLLPMPLLLLAIWFFSTFAASPAVRTAEARGGTTITLESVTTTINGCDTLDLYVRLNDVTALYGADIRLAFDPAVLEVTAVQELSGLMQAPFYVAVKQHNNTAGTVWMAWTQLNPTPPASGTGDFARITFRAKTAATNSPVTISYNKLSDINGIEIPATGVAGALTTVAPLAPTLSVAKLNPTTARLSWTAVSSASNYSLYRDTYAYFTPGAAYQTTPALLYDDSGTVGNVATNYFYTVQSTCANGFASAQSNRVGEFDFQLVTGTSPNRRNFIALPLDSTASITPYRASGLATYTGVGVTRVMRWNPLTQTFASYVPNFSPPFANFMLATGEAYMLEVDNTAPSILSLVGGVPNQGSVVFNLVQGTPSTCVYNEISLPLDKVTITQASHLAADIGGVKRVLTWNANTQSYSSYIPGFSPPFANFATKVGYPYRVCLDDTAPTTWP
jgi:hypothetical protein